MFEKISYYINKMVEYVSILMMGSLLIIILIQSGARYVFGRSTPWTSEIAMYLMVWIALICSSMIIREDKHAAILFFLKKFSNRNKIIIKLINNLVMFLFLIVLTYEGVFYALNNWNSISPATGLRRTWGYLSLSVGGFLMLIQLLFNSYKGIKSLLTGEYDMEITINEEELSV